MRGLADPTRGCKPKPPKFPSPEIQAGDAELLAIDGAVEHVEVEPIIGEDRQHRDGILDHTMAQLLTRLSACFFTQ